MKKIAIITLFAINTAFGQSIKIEPGANGFVSLPTIGVLGSCGALDKGKMVFLTSDNKFYFCNGTAWSANSFSLPFDQTISHGTNYDGGTFKITNSFPTSESVAIHGSITGNDGFAIRASALNTSGSNTGAIYATNSSTNSNGFGISGSHNGGGTGIAGGSASGKGISGYSSTGIGGYFSSGSAVGYALVTGGGFVGIGDDPEAKLHVRSFDSEKLRLENRTTLAANVETSMWFKTGALFTGAIKTIGKNGNEARMGFFTYTSTTQPGLAESLSISDDGKVGIGITTPHAPLQFSNSAVNRKIVLFEAANNDHQFYGFGINAATLRYQVENTSNAHVFYAATSSTTSNELMRIAGNGNVIVAGTVTANGILLTSDIRYKKGFSKLNTSLSSLYKIDGYNYFWKDEAKGKDLQTGVIAQEIEKIFPELVSIDDKGYKSVNYVGFIPHLIEAVKSLKNEHEKLKMKLVRLESNNQKLERRLDKIEATLYK